MVRRYTPEGKKRTFRVTYWLGVLVIAVLWIWAFKSYFDRYEYLHPEITWAVPGIDTQIIKVKGLLLWKESVLLSPAAGTLTYPLGKGPVRVARGAVVARVGGREVKAYQQGYFVAGKDGQESKWRYSSLWPAGRQEFAAAVKLHYLSDNTAAMRGQIVGKIIEQPQELRFIGYMPLRGDVEEQIKRKKLRVRIDSEDTVSSAKIRVTQKAGNLTKIYLTMPWFPPEFILSRNYTLIIDAGQTEGALVPQSAIIEKGGRTGIYMVRGARVVFVPVEGKKLANNKFLVTKGITVGDAVVEEGAAAREGRIQLW
ncbi:MAG: HlyD family efflux transporter periplasmic adaptor subunit [bacterium]|nr:HlyD family efflux transporter periplasmic adaptor subunit [bacterium]